MNCKHILFDFDGTLVDSLPLFVEITNRASADFGFRKTSIAEVRIKSARTFVKDIGLPWYKLPLMLRRGRREYAQVVSSLQPCGDILLIAAHLKERGYHLGILTTNIQSTVEDFLGRHQCTAFSFVHSEPRLFGKAHALKRLVNKLGGESTSFAYVGDEVRDIEAARKHGVTAVSVTWGFNGPELLKVHRPDALVDTPEQLLTYFE